MAAPASPDLPLRLPPALTRAGVALRRETADDRALARLFHAAARADELARVAWPPAMVAAFVDAQSAAQQAHYATHHPDADRWIVVRHDLPVGRLYIERDSPDRPDWRLLDVVLMPDARGAGVGGALVAALVRAARAAGAGVALHVARDNGRAEALYRRLGFVEVASDSASHRAMRHLAGAARASGLRQTPPGS